MIEFIRRMFRREPTPVYVRHRIPVVNMPLHRRSEGEWL